MPLSGYCLLNLLGRPIEFLGRAGAVAAPNLGMPSETVECQAEPREEQANEQCHAYSITKTLKVKSAT
jgi:hypothetical protein